MTDHHGEEVWNQDDVIGYLMSLLMRSTKEDWSDFEDALGDLDFSYDLFDPSEYTDREGDPDYYHTACNNEDVAIQLAGCVPQILDLFSEWIETIDISGIRPMAGFQRLIDPAQDLFLNFNYTRTLEEVYEIPDVCHIHGVLGEELMVGHGAGVRFDENHWSPHIGSEDGIEFIQDVLRKDTTGALKRHKVFFRRLSSGLSAVYSYGFSYGEVDEVYIQEICHTVPTDCVTWYLHSYASNNHKRFQDILRRCGFRGTFGIFH